MSQRRRAALLAGLGAAALAGYLLVFARLSDVDRRGDDFSASYVAATLWRGGAGDRLYDQPLEIARHTALVPPGYRVDLPFITPPTTAILAAPLTPLPLSAATVVASLLELLLVAAGVVVAVRAAPASSARTPAALLGLAGLGTGITLLQGQWDGFCALGLGLAYAAWRRGSSLWAGCWLGLAFTAVKPHLALGLAAFLLATRRWRAVAGASAGVAAVLAAAAVAVGPGSWVDWVGSLSASSTHSPLASLLGFTGLFGSWLGDVPAAHALAAAASVVVVAGCAALGDAARRRPDRLEPALAGATALSLLASPHLLTHDLAVLAPAAAWMLCWAAARGRLAAGAAAWAALNAVAALDLGNAAHAPPGRLVPWALLLAGGLALTRLTPTRRLTPAYSSPGSGSGAGGVADQS